MTTHTPGPWHVGARTKPSNGISVIAQNDEWTAIAQDFNRYDRDAEVEANARLIAAAPTLLDALIQLRGAVAWIEDDAALDKAKGEADAAIAAAEGKDARP